MIKQILHQAVLMSTLIIIVPNVSAQMRIKPKHILAKEIARLNKERSKDKVHSLYVVASHMMGDDIRPKLKKKAKDVIEKKHPQVCKESDSKISRLSRCVQLDQRISPDQRFYCLESILQEFFQRKKLANALHTASQFLSVNISDTAALDASCREFKRLRPELRGKALRHLYHLGGATIVSHGSTKKSFRLAHKHFAACSRIDANYMDVQERLSECISRGTITVNVLFPTSESGGNNYSAAKLLFQDISIRMLSEKKHPFLKLVAGPSENADVTIKLHVMKTTVKTGDIPSHSTEYSKNVTVNGISTMLKATLNDHTREKFATVIGSMTVMDNTGLGLNSDPTRITGREVWSYHWSTVSGGNKEAIPSKLRYKLRKPMPYPNNQEMIEKAVRDIYGHDLQPVFRMIRNAL